PAPRRRLTRRAPDAHATTPNPSPTAPAAQAPAPSDAPGQRLDDLYRLPMQNLLSLRKPECVADHPRMNRGQVSVGLVRRQIERGLAVHGAGALEVLPDGSGFLRSAAHNFLASREDIYVWPSQTRRLGRRTGLVVGCPRRLPVEGQ